MRTILVDQDVKKAGEFCEILSHETVGFQVVSSLDNTALHQIEVAIIWLTVPDYLHRLPNLKLLLVCGSGIDHIVDSPLLPRDIPMIRMADPFLCNHVADYVVERILKQFSPPSINSQSDAIPEEPKVGIMGLGQVGGTTAAALQKLGFDVCGWVRTERPRTLKQVYVGPGALHRFAAQCGVLVCQLPLTRETAGILNKNLFDHLPDGAYLINVGRGGHLNEKDLLTAIETNKLSGACLDVLENPLPAEHPFLKHPRITLTPHIAGYVQPETQAPHAAKIIVQHYQNQHSEGMVDYSRAY